MARPRPPYLRHRHRRRFPIPDAAKQPNRALDYLPLRTTFDLYTQTWSRSERVRSPVVTRECNTRSM